MPLTPVDGVDLAAYASLSARLSLAMAPRTEVLALAGLDEMRWGQIEKTWLLRIAAALLQNDVSLARAHDEAFASARATLLPAAPPRSLAEYAALVARIESGEEPSDVLSSAHISPVEWGALVRAWGARLPQDSSLAAEFRAHLARARAKRG